MFWVRISIRGRCTTLCDKVCQWLATGWWFSPGPSVSSTNKNKESMVTRQITFSIHSLDATILNIGHSHVVLSKTIISSWNKSIIIMASYLCLCEGVAIYKACLYIVIVMWNTCLKITSVNNNNNCNMHDIFLLMFLWIIQRRNCVCKLIYYLESVG
jgi:hypothetical protein